MTRLSLPVLGTAFALSLTALPSHALDLSAMNDAERASFREEIRAYLLENPEVIMEAVAVLEQREQAAQADADVALAKEHMEALHNDGHSWVGGNPEGDITLVEFVDYRCGYCRKAAPEVEQLVEMDGDIRLIMKEFPILGEESEASSRFAIATQQVAGDDAYKAVHDALITLKGPANEVAFKRLAEGLDLDGEAILAKMDSAEVTAVIAANHQLGQLLGISGTPSFVMNDQMLRGYLPLAGMMQMAEEIRTQ